MGEGNGWLEWKNLVLESIRELKKDHKGFGLKLSEIQLELQDLKTKERLVSAFIGAVSGSLISAVFYFIVKQLG